MTKRFDFDELDPTTKDYLRAARDCKGAGMPAVFLAGSDYWPIVSVIAGTVILIATLIVTVPPYGDPLKTAMLQTAGLLLGGWLVLAALRVWMAKSSGRYLGYFFLADPLHFWQARGSQVQATNLEELQKVKAADTESNGTYQSTLLTLVIPNNAYRVTVTDPDHRLEGFLKALVTLRSGQQALNMPPEALGLLAKQMSAPEQEPIGNDSEPVAIPAQPRRLRPARFGFLPYVLMVGFAVACICLLPKVNIRLRDDAMFEAVKNREAPELRAYLVDPRNTRHRAEVEALLARAYQASLQQLRQQVKDELGQEFIELVSGLQAAVEPLVSLRVKEKSELKADVGPLGVPQIQMREKSVHTELAQGLTRAVGPKLIDIVEVVKEVPALIDIDYGFDPVKDRPGQYRVTWKVSVKKHPDAKDAKTRRWTSDEVFSADGLSQSTAPQIRKTLLALTGDPKQVVPRQAPKLP